MPAERAHTFLATPSRMQNHRSKERRAAQRRLYSRLSTLKRRTSCGRGTPCVNTISEAIPSIMLRETPDDRRVAAPALHFVVVWKRLVKNESSCHFFFMKLCSRLTSPAEFVMLDCQYLSKLCPPSPPRRVMCIDDGRRLSSLRKGWYLLLGDLVPCVVFISSSIDQLRLDWTRSVLSGPRFSLPVTALPSSCSGAKAVRACH